MSNTEGFSKSKLLLQFKKKKEQYSESLQPPQCWNTAKQYMELGKDKISLEGRQTIPENIFATMLAFPDHFGTFSYVF